MLIVNGVGCWKDMVEKRGWWGLRWEAAVCGVNADLRRPSTLIVRSPDINPT